MKFSLLSADLKEKAGPSFGTLTKAGRLILLIFFVFLPLNVKKFFWPFGRGLDDLQGIFLYAADISLFVFLVISIFLFRRDFFRAGPRFIRTVLGVFLAVAGLSLFQAGEILPAAYHFAKLLLAAAGAWSLALFLRSGLINLKKIAAVIAGGAVFQSWLGFYQFAAGQSLGLRWLGEPVVADKFTAGMARYAAAGQVFLRAFGTLPHANIFAAFLVLGLLALAYLWLIRRPGNLKNSLFLGIGFLSISVGLVASFSRSGWLSAIVGLAVLVLAGLKNRILRRETFSLFVLLAVIAGLLLSYWGWLILPRAGFTLAEVSVADRLTYNKIGWEIIKDNPLGVGIGNQVFYAADQGLYQAAGLARETLWQPIHNLYLLIGTEIGWLGLVLFLAFIGWLKLKTLRLPASPEKFFALATSASLLFFGLFDHFLWDLQSGVLMFWLVVGIMGSGVLETRS